MEDVEGLIERVGVLGDALFVFGRHGLGPLVSQEAATALSGDIQALLTRLHAIEGERDEWKEKALDRGVVGSNWMDRAWAAEAERDAAISQRDEARKGLEFYACDCEQNYCESGSHDDVICGFRARSLLSKVSSYG